MADLGILETLLDLLPATPLPSFGDFKAAWRALHACNVLLVRCEDEDKEEYMADIYRVCTERLGATDDRRQRIWALYALYTLHECQVTSRKYKISLPQFLWTALDECAQDFVRLPLQDPICLLRTMLDKQMFEFHVDYPRAPPVASDQAHARAEAKWEERPTKHRKLLISSEYDGALSQLHELSDLKSHLHLPQLRELSLAYAQSMHDAMAEDPSRHAAAASSSSAAGVSSAATPSPSSSAAMPSMDQLSLLSGGASSSAPAATFSSASFKLLQRVERAFEDQRELTEQLRQQAYLDAQAVAAASASMGNNLFFAHATGVLARGRPPPPLTPADTSSSPATLSSADLQAMLLRHQAAMRVAPGAEDGESKSSNDGGHERASSPRSATKGDAASLAGIPPGRPATTASTTATPSSDQHDP